MTSCVSCGTGGFTGPAPGDPDLDNSVLQAVPAFGGIDVSWSFPELNSHALAHTLLYRSSSTNVETAVLHSVVGGNRFFDQVLTGTQWHYWIRMRSVNGTLGDWIGPASATANPLIADFLVTITGEIDEGALANALKTRLDQIELLGTNLAGEITAREDGHTTLADAIADVNAGVAEALTFLDTEIATRVSQNSAMVATLDLQAVTLGDQIVAVETSTTTAIDALSGRVDALWVVKLTVNDLVGGFALANDGDTVEAGFDVDTFWVGRTSADKIKPFVISGGVVYIDEAVIKNAAIDTLKIQNDAVTVPVGVAGVGGTAINESVLTPVMSLTIDSDGQPIYIVANFNLRSFASTDVTDQVVVGISVDGTFVASMKLHVGRDVATYGDSFGPNHRGTLTHYIASPGTSPVSIKLEARADLVDAATTSVEVSNTYGSNSLFAIGVKR